MAPAPGTSAQDYGPPPPVPSDAYGYCNSLKSEKDRYQCLWAANQGPPAFSSYYYEFQQYQAHVTSAPSSATSSLPAQSSATVTSSNGATVESETVIPNSLSSSTSGSYSTYVTGPPGSNPAADKNHHHNDLPGYLTAATIVIPLIILGFIIAAIIGIVRHKRKQRRLRGAAPEMKDLNPNRPQVESAYIRPPSSEPPPSVVAAAAQASIPPTNRESQPVILSSTIDGAYYTGLDTADHISLAEVRSQASQDPFEHGDEPPPPYRPRSVPPISRETSVRTAYRNSVSRNSSQRTYRDPLVSNGLMGPVRRSQDMRSPFDDPSEDDAISEISTVRETPRRQGDQLSVVSDLSYQEEEPVVGHSAV